MDFTKIKANADRLHFEYVERLGDDYADFSMNHPNDASPQFMETLKDLRTDFAKLLDLSEETSFIERIEIHTLSISYKGAELNRSVIISGDIKCARGSFNVNTPLQALDNPDDTSVNVLFNQKIQKVINEAEKYLQGEKSQLNMFNLNQVAANY